MHFKFWRKTAYLLHGPRWIIFRAHDFVELNKFTFEKTSKINSSGEKQAYKRLGLSTGDKQAHNFSIRFFFFSNIFSLNNFYLLVVGQ